MDGNTALYAFDPYRFLVFMLIFYIIPYPIYRSIAHYYSWETNEKTMSRHWSDLVNGVSYGLILFIFGNYTHTLGWVTVAAFIPSLFAYALIAELPFTRTSLPNIKHWPKGMWVVFIMAVSVILAFAAYHIYLGSLLPAPFLFYYVSALVIPVAILCSGFALRAEVNSNYCRSRIAKWRRKREEVTETTSLLETVSPYSRRISIHLHHWQIFYVLAFFTRFDHIVSQIGAGIVLACYMEGVCAYGYDALVNDD